eukprot:TRINITY_DN1905_c0_g1_i3.p1 TRINITY_DN1905_c0_g1~~TRINITY_DN1905_c0_g1_i3.p1  ORF type:complete len:300 (-),score=74.36 TRINITY_DN1905_c0_g1_i3:1-900(-)
MQDLPIGFPKVVVSTVAGGDVTSFVGEKDITMIPSIVDISGINRISNVVLTRAVGAICGMVVAEPEVLKDTKPLIVASMFGNTTIAVECAKSILEKEGYEVLVFHATGKGGKTMEGLIKTKGLIAGVLDITTTEWADELVGGVLTAGPTRLEAAAEEGVPAIVVPGCIDMVNFWAEESIPAKFKEPSAGRLFYHHNVSTTLMRTTKGENKELGRIIATKLNNSKAPTTVLIPLKGFSMLDSPDGGLFWNPDADRAFIDSLKEHLRAEMVKVVDLDCNINDPEFAHRCVAELLNNIRAIQ